MKYKAGDRVRYKIEGLPVYEGVIVGFEPQGPAWIDTRLKSGENVRVWVRQNEIIEKIDEPVS